MPLHCRYHVKFIDLGNKICLESAKERYLDSDTHCIDEKILNVKGSLASQVTVLRFTILSNIYLVLLILEIAYYFHPTSSRKLWNDVTGHVSDDGNHKRFF